MKKIFTFLLLCSILSSFSQETIPEKQSDSVPPKTGEIDDRGLHFNIIWRIYYAKPNQIGDHVWKDAYSSGFSMGTSLGLLKFQNFRISGGLEIENYDVTDVSKAGNFNRVRKSGQFLFLSYDYKINESFLLVPTIGFGSVAISQKYDSERIASQSGNDIRLGLFCDYSLGKGAAVFVGVHYITTKFDISTNNAYQSYFEKSNQLQLTLGLKVH